MTVHVDVLELMSRLKAAEEPFALATVVRTVSVTAAKAGPKALTRPDGRGQAGWIGGAGPGAGYGDEGLGLDNDFTNRNTSFMTWNLMHLAKLLKDAGGFPVGGNQRSGWDAGRPTLHPRRHRIAAICHRLSNNATGAPRMEAVSYTHLRAHETVLDLVCRLLLDKKTQKDSTPHHPPVVHIVNIKKINK